MAGSDSLNIRQIFGPVSNGFQDNQIFRSLWRAISGSNNGAMPLGADWLLFPLVLPIAGITGQVTHLAEDRYYS